MTGLDQNAPPSSKPEGAGAEEPRCLRAWKNTQSPTVGKPFQIRCNVGDPLITDWRKSVPQVLLDPHVEMLDVLITLSARDCEVDSGCELLSLPKVGESEFITFQVTPQRAGEHEGYMRLLLYKQMIQLQVLTFTFTATE